MNKLADIQTQIEKLQKQAQAIKAKEFQNTVQEILKKMQTFGITLKDLQTAKFEKPVKSETSTRGKSKSGAAKKSQAAPADKKPVEAKYLGPNGETWSGRGLTPRWLATLIAEGKSKESFKVRT